MCVNSGCRISQSYISYMLCHANSSSCHRIDLDSLLDGDHSQELQLGYCQSLCCWYFFGANGSYLQVSIALLIYQVSSHSYPSSFSLDTACPTNTSSSNCRQQHRCYIYQLVIKMYSIREHWMNNGDGLHDGI